MEPSTAPDPSHPMRHHAAADQLTLAQIEAIAKGAIQPPAQTAQTPVVPAAQAAVPVAAETASPTTPVPTPTPTPIPVTPSPPVEATVATPVVPTTATPSMTALESAAEPEPAVPQTRPTVIKQKVIQPPTMGQRDADALNTQFAKLAEAESAAPATPNPSVVGVAPQVVQPAATGLVAEATAEPMATPPPVPPPMVAAKEPPKRSHPHLIGTPHAKPLDELTNDKAISGAFGVSSGAFKAINRILWVAFLLVSLATLVILYKSGQLTEWWQNLVVEPIHRMSQP